MRYCVVSSKYCIEIKCHGIAQIPIIWRILSKYLYQLSTTHLENIGHQLFQENIQEFFNAISFLLMQLEHYFFVHIKRPSRKVRKKTQFIGEQIRDQEMYALKCQTNCSTTKGPGSVAQDQYYHFELGANNVERCEYEYLCLVDLYQKPMWKMGESEKYLCIE